MRVPFQVDYKAKTFSSRYKIKYSFDTSIAAYQRTFGSNLVIGKQIWSLPALQNDYKIQERKSYLDGRLIPGSELDRYLQPKFCTADQYHGVDYEEEIIKANECLWNSYPEEQRPHWYKGDFYQTMVETKARGEFNPGIVHFDSYNMPKKGSQYAARIMSLLLDHTNLLYVMNFVLINWRDPSQNYTNEEVMEHVMRWPQMTIAFNHGWTFLDDTPTVYTYTQRLDRPWMGSIVLVQTGKI